MHYIPKFEARFLPSGLFPESTEVQEIIEWITTYNHEYYVDRIIEMNQRGTLNGLWIGLRGSCEQVAYLTVDQYLVLGLDYAKVVSKSDFNKYFIGLAD